MGHSRFRSAKLRSLRWLGAMAIGFAIAVPASAQVTIQFGGPQVSGFSNNYPWFNDMPQYQGDQSFRYFLAYHPNIAYALSRNPGLLYNAEWRSQYPQLEDYLANHPYAWQALNGADWATGPAETQWGSYDDQNQWRDAYWWHQNDANWFYDNHQDWASLDSRWLSQDGAYDPQNQWHYGEWWYNQNPGWVSSNHPLWLQQHRNWASASEQQSYRQRMAMPTQNLLNQQRAVNQRQASIEQQQNLRQQNLIQQQANQKQNQQRLNEQRQVNQQRAIDQRQANVEQQQSMRQENQRQQQANQEQNLQNRQQNRENQQRAVDQRQANAAQQQNMRQEDRHQQQANQVQHQENEHQNQENRQGQDGHGGGNQH